MGRWSCRAGWTLAVLGLLAAVAAAVRRRPKRLRLRDRRQATSPAAAAATRRPIDRAHRRRPPRTRTGRRPVLAISTRG